MKKKLVKILSAFLCASMLTACGASGAKDGGAGNTGSTAGAESTGTAEPKECTIGVALYQDGGPAAVALKAFLEETGKYLNCDFKYTVLTQTDEAANLTKIQELIAANVDGIICTMDMGMPAIVSECEAAGVYLGGYLSDYDSSFKNTYDQVFKNPMFVGTVADGRCSDDLVGGYEFFNSLLEYNEAHPDAPIDHVSMTTFPVWAFPQHQVYVQQFTEKVEEYNKTAAQKITLDPLNEETDVLMFSPVDSTYFTKHPDIDAVISFCAGQFVYGTMVNAGIADKIKLFSSGYAEGDSENFGSAGTKTYQQEIVCACESVVFPLVQLVNAINDVKYSDAPEVAERVSCSQMIMNSDEDMAKFKASLYMTGDVKDAFLTGEEVLNLTALNKDATYAGLKEVLNHMTIEDVK